MGIGTKSGIMAAAGSSAVGQKVFREFFNYQNNQVGANAGSGNWLTEVSESNSDQVAGPQSDGNSVSIRAGAYSGRGSTIYDNSRVYMGLYLGGSQGITGSITAADIYLPVSRSVTYDFGGALNVYSAFTGSKIDGSVADYSLYFSSVFGNKTAYSDSQTISANTVLTYSLNDAAITVLNDNNNFGGSAEDINFAIVFDFDFNGIAPTLKHRYRLSITGSQLDNPDYLNIGGYLPPRIEITYIPD